MSFRDDLRRYAGRTVPIDKRQVQGLLKEGMSAIYRGKGFGPMFDGLARDVRSTGNAKLRIMDYSHGTALKHPLGRYQTTSVDGRDIDIPVYLKVKPGPRYGVRDYIVGGKVEATRDGSPRALTLFVNNAITPEKLLRGRDDLRDELYSVLIHEVTHVHDVLGEASGDLDKSLSREERQKAYYNLPHEVRAFMQQIVDEALVSLEDYEPEEIPETLSSRFIMDLLIGSDTWFRVAEYLTPSNTKKILRAVARAVEDKVRG